MPYSLRNRRILVIAGSRGLGAAVAKKFARAGASHIAIAYHSNAGAAESVAGECRKLGAARCIVQRVDGSVSADLEAAVNETASAFGGLDIIIGNQGYTEFTEFGNLNAMTEDQWTRCWSTNVYGQMVLLRAAKPYFNANEEGGVLIMTSSVAGTMIGGSSMPYSVSKAAQIQLMKCLAQTQGPKCRINCVLPGLMLTEWITVDGYSQQQQQTLIDRAALKKSTDVEDCADAYVMIASNSSMTGQMVTVDAGVNIQGR